MQILLIRRFSLPCFFILLFFARCTCPRNSVIPTSNELKGKQSSPVKDDNLLGVSHAGEDSHAGDNPAEVSHANSSAQTGGGPSGGQGGVGSVTMNNDQEPTAFAHSGSSNNANSGAQTGGDPSGGQERASSVTMNNDQGPTAFAHSDSDNNKLNFDNQVNIDKKTNASSEPEIDIIMRDISKLINPNKSWVYVQKINGWNQACQKIKQEIQGEPDLLKKKEKIERLVKELSSKKEKMKKYKNKSDALILRCESELYKQRVCKHKAGPKNKKRSFKKNFYKMSTKIKNLEDLSNKLASFMFSSQDEINNYKEELKKIQEEIQKKINIGNKHPK
ncbi:MULTISPECIES: hypothetical protein [Candidatus Cardinium]|uniref:hypothetical protein n=1 Tax=Candidatus Cardinium TaxID=273135 RepID=UPI001FAA7619|nr:MULTISPECIES: hypothetical protein [Cardinium]